MKIQYNAETTYHLLCCHAYRLDGELACAHVEEVLKIRTKQIDYEDIVESFLPEMEDLRNAHWKLQLERQTRGNG